MTVMPREASMPEHYQWCQERRASVHGQWCQEMTASVHYQWCQKKGGISALPVISGDENISAPSSGARRKGASMRDQWCQEI